MSKSDKKNSRYRTIKPILGVKDNVFGKGLNSFDICEGAPPLVGVTRLALPQAGCLTERLELLILETKAGHDGLYDEMLNISKQLLSMNNINQEQADNFVFNCGK